jgi:23S rRNA pseudouridine1911/1915/1917 synthase
LCIFALPDRGRRSVWKKEASVEIDRHFLHAYRLKIILLGEKEPRLFEAPLPEELELVLAAVRAAQ